VGGSRSHKSAAALAAALCISPGANAAEDVSQKAQACVACHGAGGNSTDAAVPSLAAQPAQFIATQLYFFREGERKNLQMSPLAAGLSNAEMNELAAFFSKQKPSGAPHRTSPENLAEGRRLAGQHHCVQCHGAKLLGLQHIPRLAGQQAAYLKAQLRAFKARSRADLDGTMTSAAQPLSDENIDVLADYLSGLDPRRD
jgi:cytochrome c553